MKAPIAGLAIRPMDALDAEDYRNIRLAALQAAPDAFSSTYEVEASSTLTEFAERLTTSTVFGAFADGGLVGMAGFRQETSPKKTHKGFVWGMYVHPQSRSLGVGSALLRALVQFADDRVDNLILAVAEGNAAAIALYQKQGFEVYGVEPRALTISTGYCDEILMVRFPPPRQS